MIPTWASLVLGLAVAAIIALSPPLDTAATDDWQRQRQLPNSRSHVALHGTDDLPPASVRSLLEDRREALELLRSRGLLDEEHDIEDLARGPLDQLVVRDVDGDQG